MVEDGDLDAESEHAPTEGAGGTARPPGVQDATATDVPALLGIQAAALPSPDPAFLRAAVRTGLVLVAEPLAAGPGTDPVGYLSHTVDDRAVYVAELAVAPGHRRRGHASRLLDAVAARYDDRAELRLTTRRSNQRARAFYASAGFREARTLPGHYETTAADGADTGSDGADDEDGEGVDGVLLVRDL